MATTTKFPQPIDHMTRKNLRMLANILILPALVEASHNAQRKEAFVTAIKAA
jgi:hypothetical protein